MKINTKILWIPLNNKNLFIQIKYDQKYLNIQVTITKASSQRSHAN